MADTKFGEIAVYEDEDGKAVWEFEGKVQSDIPLDTKAQDFAGAINELKKLSEQGGGEVWRPPDWWLEVPEPGEWEANFLIEIRNVFTFTFIFRDPVNGWNGHGILTIDWGDGTVETFRGYTINEQGNFIGTSRATTNTHTYSEPGQYVIKTVTDDLSCGLAVAADTVNTYGRNCVNLLIAKTGKNIRFNKGWDNFNNYGAFMGCYRLRWLKVNGNSELAPAFLSGCGNLRRLEFAEPVTEVPNECFTDVVFPSNFDFSKIVKIGYRAFMNSRIPVKLTLPECTELAANAFNYCPLEEINLPKCEKIPDYAFRDFNFPLRAVYAPNCTSVGTYAFSGKSKLETAEFSDNCTFGANCFQLCNSLYPRPDGSTN